MSEPTPINKRDAAPSLVVAEYESVSQLIPLYRQMETFVLAGTGLIVSGAIAAFAALTSGEHPDPDKAAVVLAAAT